MPGWVGAAGQTRVDGGGRHVDAAAAQLSFAAAPTWAGGAERDAQGLRPWRGAEQTCRQCREKVRVGRLGVQRHERGDVVGVDGHRSCPLVQARGEGRQDRSSLAMGTARPAAGGGHIALLCGSRGPASPRRPARPRAPAAEPRRTSADDRRMGKRCISPAHPRCSERRGAHTAWRRAHGCGRGKFGARRGSTAHVRGRHHNGSGPFPARSELWKAAHEPSKMHAL